MCAAVKDYLIQTHLFHLYGFGILYILTSKTTALFSPLRDTCETPFFQRQTLCFPSEQGRGPLYNARIRIHNYNVVHLLSISGDIITVLFKTIVTVSRQWIYSCSVCGLSNEMGNTMCPRRIKS